MKIIKHGEEYRKAIQFTCECGCVFEADSNEYMKTYTDTTETKAAYFVNCPECKKLIFLEEEDEITNHEH